MASGYALPRGSHLDHFHSFSPYANDSNGGAFVKKATSNGSLYTHNEATHEEQNTAAYQANRSQPTNHNIHTHSYSQGAMKGRMRGESDLGRPVSSCTPARESILAASTAWFSLPEALTALLIPLPLLLASGAFASTHGHVTEEGFDLPAYARMQHGAASHPSVMLPPRRTTHGPSLLETCALTSGTLLLVGIIAKIRSVERTLDRRKDLVNTSQQIKALMTASSAQTMAVRILSLGLPFYAAMQLGGLRVGIVLLASVAADLSGSAAHLRGSSSDWKQILTSRVASITVMIISMLSDFAGWTFHASILDVALGYLALTCSVFLLPPPLPTLAAVTSSRPGSKMASPTTATSPWRFSAVSPLISSIGDQNSTFVAGLTLSLFTAGASLIWSTSFPISSTALTFSALSIVTMTCAILFSNPPAIRSKHKAGMAVACLLSASVAFLFSPELWPGTICNGSLSALSFVGVLYDTTTQDHHDEHVHEHAHNTHPRHDHHPHQHHEHAEAYSSFTKFVLGLCKPGSLAHGILCEKDSRRIAYFTVLNFGFMLVQGVYGYMSGSLGLLSDTVHMFFDCLGLIVGLGAAVASKWPTSPDKPYGWGKLNTLAGFGNGVFLMLVSLEFVWEAIEGMVEGQELRHVKELMVVTVLGFVVNMVGLFAFGHAHAGHDHGHSHGHSHDHGHSHGHSDGHAHADGHTHGQDCDHAQPSPTPAAHDHHHNENMHGLFLHVAADAGGSLAVIISTALTLWRPWYLWDPLATIIIAVLIFAMAVPLVKSSGQKLLLVIPDDLEYLIKHALQDLGELRGVVGYTVPRFWVDDKEDAGDAAHDHHDHGHSAHAHSDSQHDHHHHHPPPAHAVAAPKRNIPGKRVMGVIHIIAALSADLEDVRARVDEFVRDRGMDLVIQVERQNDTRCWCGGQK